MDLGKSAVLLKTEAHIFARISDIFSGVELRILTRSSSPGSKKQRGGTLVLMVHRVLHRVVTRAVTVK